MKQPKYDIGQVVWIISDFPLTLVSLKIRDIHIYYNKDDEDSIHYDFGYNEAGTTNIPILSKYHSDQYNKKEEWEVFGSPEEAKQYVKKCLEIE